MELVYKYTLYQLCNVEKDDASGVLGDASFDGWP